MSNRVNWDCGCHAWGRSRLLHIRVTWWLHWLTTNAPLIACVINSPSAFLCYLNLSIFILESGLSYFKVLTICFLLVYFVNVAGCHFFYFNEFDNLGSGKSSLFFVSGWIKLKFCVKSNFWLLISNRNSKTQYQFEILRKCHLSSIRSWFLAQHSLMNW